eukprot:Pgem_evm1s5253
MHVDNYVKGEYFDDGIMQMLLYNLLLIFKIVEGENFFIDVNIIAAMVHSKFAEFLKFELDNLKNVVGLFFFYKELFQKEMDISREIDRRILEEFDPPSGVGAMTKWDRYEK